MWLFTSKPSADRKLAIPYSGPWKVTKQLAGTLRTIRPEGDWCRQPKDITVSLNRLKRCHGEARTPQRIDHDLRQLEDAEDGAEGPMQNAWITDEGAAATQGLNQEAGDVHAPSLRERTTASATPQPAPCLFSRHRDVEDMAPSIVVYHERSTAGEPGSTITASEPTPKTDSTTMTEPGLSTPATPTRDPPRTWLAPRTQQLFDKSAQVRPCSSQVLEPEEVALLPVLEELEDDVFSPRPSPGPQPSLGSQPSPTPRPSPASRITPVPRPSPRSHRILSASTTMPSSTSATAVSTTDTTLETDSGTEDRHGRKRSVSTSDTSYSQAHRTLVRGPSNYPKRPERASSPGDVTMKDPRGQKRLDTSSDTSYSREHRTTSVGPSNYPNLPNRPHFVDSSEEEEQLPPPSWLRSSDSEYSREHLAALEDRHHYPKRQLRQQ